MKNEEIWEGYYGEWHGGLYRRLRGTHKGKYGDGFVPERRVNASLESPWDIFPVATAVLTIGLVVTFVALVYIEFFMPLS